MDVRIMIELRKIVHSCVIDCACDLFRVIVDCGFFVAYSNEWYLRE